MTDSLDVLARHGRSFHLASFLLPADRRDDAALLYHFCRVVDDLVDEDEDLDDLAALRRELQGVGMPRPLVQRMRDLQRRRKLPMDALLHLIDGVTSDLGQVAFRDDRELLRYCYKVAGTVGLLMCAVLGVEDREALPHAVDLGVAMQLTNICRDVREDAARGRRYVPRTRGGTVPAVAGLLAEADRYYASAERGLPAIPLRSRAAIAVAAAVYAQIGRRLLRTGGDPMTGRTVVPLWEKVLAGTRALLRLPWHRRARHHTALHTHLRGLPGCTG